MPGAQFHYSDYGVHLLSPILVQATGQPVLDYARAELFDPWGIATTPAEQPLAVDAHLSRAQRVALMERLHLSLEPGGYLFLSQTEKLCAPNLNFRQETYDGYTMHRKPMAASAAYGR